jgi:hypothetical protein
MTPNSFPSNVRSCDAVVVAASPLTCTALVYENASRRRRVWHTQPAAAVNTASTHTVTYRLDEQLEWRGQRGNTRCWIAQHRVPQSALQVIPLYRGLQSSIGRRDLYLANALGLLQYVRLRPAREGGNLRRQVDVHGHRRLSCINNAGVQAIAVARTVDFPCSHGSEGSLPLGDCQQGVSNASNASNASKTT